MITCHFCKKQICDRGTTKKPCKTVCMNRDTGERVCRVHKLNPPENNGINFGFFACNPCYKKWDEFRHNGGDDERFKELMILLRL
jgi:hypothetical protein